MRDLGQPLGPCGRRLEERGDHVAQAGTVVVGQERLGQRRPVFPRPAVRASRAVGWAVVKVSTRGDYAARALLSLALHEETSGPTSVRDIAERTGLPQPYLEQILLALKGA
ncbi:MAG TPA: Rrf2 family transcriptional regulator, partial [Acidimicrobiales bacterium]|nr:Rrf2 family transcriptional regulator [Acidimicrobiales bacterium]